MQRNRGRFQSTSVENGEEDAGTLLSIFRLVSRDLSVHEQLDSGLRQAKIFGEGILKNVTSRVHNE